MPDIMQILVASRVEQFLGFKNMIIVEALAEDFLVAVKYDNLNTGAGLGAEFLENIDNLALERVGITM